MSWSINIKNAEQLEQFSFIGGRPRLPEGNSIPCCKLCGAEQSFMFQILMPEKSIWAGKIIALFFCISCASQDYLIPEMLEGGLLNADIPPKFLDNYQKNFSFFIFSNENLRVIDTYSPTIAFKELVVKKDKRQGDFGKIGGKPEWLLDDESPSTYSQNIPMKFIMEIYENYEFSRVTSAPAQVRYSSLGLPRPTLPYYKLFLGNRLYFFGTTKNEPLLYILTQVD